MIGDRALRVSMLLDRAGDRPVPFELVCQDMLREYRIKCRPVGITLTMKGASRKDWEKSKSMDLTLRC